MKRGWLRRTFAPCWGCSLALVAVPRPDGLDSKTKITLMNAIRKRNHANFQQSNATPLAEMDH